MENNEIECLVDIDGNKYYVLKNSSLDLSNENIINYANDFKELDNKNYYNNKLMHREDGPAIEYKDGTTAWYKNGLGHREDGPAIEYINGDKFWYQNGLLHREDGPAIEWSDGDKVWYINGKNYIEEEFNIYIEKKKLKEDLSLNLIKRDDNKTKFKI